MALTGTGPWAGWIRSVGQGRGRLSHARCWVGSATCDRWQCHAWQIRSRGLSTRAGLAGRRGLRTERAARFIGRSLPSFPEMQVFAPEFIWVCLAALTTLIASVHHCFYELYRGQIPVIDYVMNDQCWSHVSFSGGCLDDDFSVSEAGGPA